MTYKCKRGKIFDLLIMKSKVSLFALIFIYK